MESKIAGFWQRLAASYLSLFIYLLLAYAIYSAAQLKEIKILIIVAVLISFIDTLALAYSGYNLAGALLGIRQLTAYEHKPMLLKRGLIHYLFSWFSLLILGLGYIAGFFNQSSRNLQDIVSDSVAVEAPLIPYITRPLSATFSLIGFLLTLAIPASLALLLILLLKSGLLLSNSPYYSSPLWETDSAKTLKIDLAANKVIALTRLHPSDISYIPYKLDQRLERSTINAAKLKELDLNIFDYVYKLSNIPPDILAASIEDITKIKLNKQVLAQELIMQDHGDIVVHDLLMDVTDSSILGRDVLDMFKTTIKDSSLELALHNSDAEIYADTELEAAYREALLRNLALLHYRWQQQLAAMPARLTEELTLKPQELSNPIELSVEAGTGFIVGMVILEPTKSDLYNQFCKNFISSMKRLKPIPHSLADRYPQIYNLRFDLKREAQVL